MKSFGLKRRWQTRKSIKKEVNNNDHNDSNTFKDSRRR